jgi:hypothetical protein
MEEGQREDARGDGVSTKKIRDLIAWTRAQDADTTAFDGTPIGPPVLIDVEAEVEAIEKTARALLLAFRYIGDRSAGSSEAWAALADALDLDADETGAGEMLAALDEHATEAT